MRFAGSDRADLVCRRASPDAGGGSGKELDPGGAALVYLGRSIRRGVASCSNCGYQGTPCRRAVHARLRRSHWSASWPSRRARRAGWRLHSARMAQLHAIERWESPVSPRVSVSAFRQFWLYPASSPPLLSALPRRVALRRSRPQRRSAGVAGPQPAPILSNTLRALADLVLLTPLVIISCREPAPNFDRLARLIAGSNTSPSALACSAAAPGSCPRFANAAAHWFWETATADSPPTACDESGDSRPRR